MAKVIALDAMGVLYRHADDVADLLLPYLAATGCPLSPEAVTTHYVDCSLGGCSSVEFWRRCGVDGDDDEYCRGHELTDGMAAQLQRWSAAGFRLACLSNDVAEWSRVLRTRFGLTCWIDTWVISGDIGLRKPDPRAYQVLLDELDTDPADVMFVDDRAHNVAAAAALGIRAVQFAGVAETAEAVRSWV